MRASLAPAQYIAAHTGRTKDLDVELGAGKDNNWVWTLLK
jgi:hypothetical protein